STGHLSESGTTILEHQNLIATSDEEADQNESQAEGCKRSSRRRFAGCLSGRPEKVRYQQSGDDHIRNAQYNAIQYARTETDPESAIAQGRWRRAARHHPAQKCRLAIGTHPAPGDMHQVRGRKRASTLGTRQNCLDRGFLTHCLSPWFAKSH